MIKIKESIFNIYYQFGDKKIAYNSLYCGLAEIDDKYIKLLDKIKDEKTNIFDKNEIKLLEVAKKYKYIIDDESDELLDYRTKKYYHKFNEDKLSLTIAPTLDCNFKCTYCYETCKHGIIDNNVQNNIIEFIKKRVGSIKKLSISWYGGEPLIAKEVIYTMSEKIISICEENDVEYSAFMVTNGYLLIKEDIRKLKKSRIKRFQITIDGPPNIHNNRRICKSGSNSYDTIIANVNRLLKENLKINLRINIDKSNRKYVEELFYLLSKNLVNKNIKFSFGKVTPFTEACKSISGDCYNIEEFASEYIELYKYIVKYGFVERNSFKYPKPRYNYCGASNLNFFVLDPEGYVYKCWNNIGEIKHSIGNINDNEFDRMSYKHGKWLFNEPIDEDECKACKVLPLCMGGCPQQSYGQITKRQCDAIKYNLEEVLKYNYNERR